MKSAAAKAASRAWRERAIAAGRCIDCGGHAGPTQRCVVCQNKRRERYRNHAQQEIEAAKRYYRLNREACIARSKAWNATHNDACRRYKAKERVELSDNYVARVLRVPARHLPTQIIEAKRAQLMLRRACHKTKGVLE